MIKVKFIMFAIFIGWEFWFLNYTLMNKNYELNICKTIKLVGEISNNYPNSLFGMNESKALRERRQNIFLGENFFRDLL